MGSQRQQFEAEILVHLDKAYNLARWLLRDGSEAEDIVQQACIRAFRAWPRFRGENPLGWLLTIVRNTSFNHLKSKQNTSNLVSFDEALHHDDQHEITPCSIQLDPSQLLELAKGGLLFLRWSMRSRRPRKSFRRVAQALLRREITCPVPIGRDGCPCVRGLHQKDLRRWRARWGI